jgi:hypothetical protein
MLIFHGRKTARIKKFTDNQQHCPKCKAFDLNIEIFRDYYHFYFIPIIALGDKIAKIRCKSCGEPYRSEKLETEYANSNKTPFYLYSLIILFICIICFVAFNSYNNKRQKIEYAKNPKINDVYLIKNTPNSFTSYYFYKIVAINKDSFSILHGKYEYLETPSEMSEKDYFMKEDTLLFSKNEIKNMSDSALINSIERNYNAVSGFNRIK